LLRGKAPAKFPRAMPCVQVHLALAAQRSPPYAAICPFKNRYRPLHFSRLASSLSPPAACLSPCICAIHRNARARSKPLLSLPVASLSVRFQVSYPCRVQVSICRRHEEAPHLGAIVGPGLPGRVLEFELVEVPAHCSCCKRTGMHSLESRGLRLFLLEHFIVPLDVVQHNEIVPLRLQLVARACVILEPTEHLRKSPHNFTLHVRDLAQGTRRTSQLAQHTGAGPGFSSAPRARAS